MRGPNGRLNRGFSSHRAVELLECRMLLSFDNVLVNDPNQDPPTSEHDTQSETSLIAFGSTVIVGFNDSGANVVNNFQFTGWSRSVDGGSTFTDMGNLPLDTDMSDGADGDFGDPVLARDAVSGTIYFATLSRRTFTPVSNSRQPRAGRC